MSPTPYQEHQPCLEPRLVQQEALRLKLAPHLVSPPPTHPQIQMPGESAPTTKCNTGLQHCSSFGSITSLPSASREDASYVHPLLRRSASMMSDKSLKICTENLGSDSGTDTSVHEANYLFSSPSPSPPSSPLSLSSSSSFSSSCYSERTKYSDAGRRAISSGKSSSLRTLPPPLTSISGGSCIRVKPYREEGRLIIKAVTTPSCRAYFQADRSQGRLCLRFLKSNSHSNDEVKAVDNDDKEEIAEVDLVEPKEQQERHHHQQQKQPPQQEGLEELEVEEGSGGDGDGGEDEGEEQDEGLGYKEMSRDLRSTTSEEQRNCGGSIGIMKIQRPSSRCNERGHGNKRILSWEPFCVASS